MTWTVTRRGLGPDVVCEYTSAEVALEILCASLPNLTGTGAELAIRGDGGWTEAPTPTTCWDPRTPRAEQKQPQPERGC